MRGNAMRLAMAVPLLCIAGCDTHSSDNRAADPPEHTRDAATPGDANSANDADGQGEARTLSDGDPNSAAVDRWLIGAWSYEASCATDFAARFHADGRVENAGDIGTWTAHGDRVTERITRRFELGDESEETLDPPEVRSYRVERVDADRGVIVIDGRRVPIRRC